MLQSKHFSAIEEYKKAIALDSNNVEAYYNLGLNLENVGMLNQATYYYDIFIILLRRNIISKKRMSASALTASIAKRLNRSKNYKS